MKVELARSAGFCYGVKRAVRMAEEAARSGKPCYMLGQIIHNDWEIRRLEALGLRLAAAPEEVPPGAAVIIRSHGEPRRVYQTLEERGVEIIDATCPTSRTSTALWPRRRRRGAFR